MISKIDTEIKNQEGLPVYIHIEYNNELIENKKAAIQKPLVVILHGFKGFKEWGFLPYLQERICAAGAITLSMDFSLNGIIDRENMLYDPEKFSRNTFTLELHDLQSVINAFENGELIDRDILSEKFNGEIYLTGHSLGGAVAIISAKKDKRIKKIALWASIAEMDRYTERQKEYWRRQGFIEFTVAQTKQVLKLNVSYMEDKLNNQDDYDLAKSIASLDIPSLIIHGSQDLTVKIDEAYKLAEHAKKELSRLVIIEKTGHGFGAMHPFDESNPHLEKAIEETIKFFNMK